MAKKKAVPPVAETVAVPTKKARQLTPNQKRDLSRWREVAEEWVDHHAIDEVTATEEIRHGGLVADTSPKYSKLGLHDRRELLLRAARFLLDAGRSQDLVIQLADELNAWVRLGKQAVKVLDKMVLHGEVTCYSYVEGITGVKRLLGIPYTLSVRIEVKLQFPADFDLTDFDEKDFIVSIRRKRGGKLIAEGVPNSIEDNEDF